MQNRSPAIFDAKIEATCFNRANVLLQTCNTLITITLNHAATIFYLIMAV